MLLIAYFNTSETAFGWIFIMGLRVIGVTVLALANIAASAPSLANIRINHLSTNLGVDVAKDAVVSWHIIDGDKTGTFQTAFSAEVEMLTLAKWPSPWERLLQPGKQ